jgi:hypothetical protein
LSCVVDTTLSTTSAAISVLQHTYSPVDQAENSYGSLPVRLK